MGKKIDIKIVSKEDKDKYTVEIMDNAKEAMKSKIINEPAVNTALTINCYIINRLAENSNVCKTISVAIAAAFIGLANDPTKQQFWFVFGIIAILFMLDSLYIGLKKNLQSLSTRLINKLESQSILDFNPFNKKSYLNKEDVESNKFNTEKGICDKIIYKLKTIVRGLISISEWPFYLAILGGLAYIHFFS